MNWASFSNSFANNLNQNGTIDKIKTLLQQNTMGGKLYDPYSDPEFIRKYQLANEMGNVAQNDFIGEYGDYLQYQQPQEGPTPLSQQDKINQLFRPAEGTPEWYRDKMNEINYIDASVESEFLPERLETNLGINKANLNQAKTYSELYPTILGQQLEQGNIAIDTGRANLDKQNTHNNYYEKLLQNQLQSGNIANDTASFNLNNAMTMQPYQMRQAEQGLESGALGIETGRFNLDQNKAMAPYQRQQAEQNLQAGDLGIQANQFNLDQNRALAPFQLRQAEQSVESGDINNNMQQEQLIQMQTNNKYLEQQIQQNLSAQELQNVNAELSNTLNQMQIEQNRQLYPYEVEMIKNQVLMSKLQNEGQRLNNQGQSITNDVNSMNLDLMKMGANTRELTDNDKMLINYLYNGTVDEKYQPPIDPQGFIIDSDTGERWIDPITGQPSNNNQVEPIDYNGDPTLWNPFTWGKRGNGTIKDSITMDFEEQFSRRPKNDMELIRMIQMANDEFIQEEYNMDKKTLLQMLQQREG